MVNYYKMKIFLSLFLLIPLFVNAENIKKHKGYGEFKFETNSIHFTIKGTFSNTKDFITCMDCKVRVTHVHYDVYDTENTGAFSNSALCRDVIPGYYKTLERRYEPPNSVKVERGIEFIADEIFLFRDTVHQQRSLNNKGINRYNFQPADSGVCNIGFIGKANIFIDDKKYVANVKRPTRLFNYPSLLGVGNSLFKFEEQKIEQKNLKNEKDKKTSKIENTNKSDSDKSNVVKKKSNIDIDSSKSNIDICIDLGFKKGTEGLKNCVLELD